MNNLSAPGPHPGRHLALAVLLAAAVMNLIDGTILNVALPVIAEDLDASSSQVGWVSVIYLLAFAAGLLPFGRFGDIFGRRKIFAWGVAGFTLASGLCGLAPNIETLLAARLAQGISGAAMIPQVLALIRAVFPADEQGSAFGKFTLVSSLSAVSGPLLGGLLMEADLFNMGWRTIFLINLPVGLAILASLSLVPEVPLDERLRSDKWGILLFAAAIIAIVLPLIEGRSLDWPWWTFVLVGAGAMLAIGFILFELEQARRGLSQLLPGALLNNRDFTVGLLHVTLLFAVPPGFILVFGIYLQLGLQLSPLQAALLISPFPAGVMIASLVTSKMAASSRSIRVTLGAAIVLGAMVFLRLAIQGTSTAEAWQLAPPVVIAGVGMGVAVVALYPKVLATVPAGDAGAGSGALQALQHVGVVIGIAAMGEVFFSSLGKEAGEPSYEAWSSAAANAALLAMAILSVLLAALGWQLWRDNRRLAHRAPSSPNASPPTEPIPSKLENDRAQ